MFIELIFLTKVFYVALPTEREKLSFLCKICQNIHLLLKGVNSYRKNKKQFCFCDKISRGSKYKGF